jgi:hypothetical protein
MPISIALLLCVPIGFLFYFEARWLIRYCLDRYESRERKAARICGCFGASLIPLIYCFGLIEREFPGMAGELFATGFFMVASWGFAGPVIATLNKGRKFEGDARDH